MTTDGAGGYLVDTNILVYGYDTLDDWKRRRAIEVVGRVRARRTGILSTQVLGEFFNAATRNLRQPLTPAQAELVVTEWARSWPVLTITAPIVLEAIRGVQRHRFPYYDGVIWATAKLNSVATVLSEDFSDGSIIEGVRFLNPLKQSFDISTL